jgi:putative restriction endonuclease
MKRINDQFLLANIDEVATVLRRSNKLAHALPNQVAFDFESSVANELAELSSDTIKNTEIERIVRQRIGQQAFRNAMLNYWGGACAVTGVQVLEVLRASHAKPWVDCVSDMERLDVFNGFLLNANLDALFDRFLISFTDLGNIIISPSIDNSQFEALGLSPDLRLRWIAESHLFYLQYHRAIFHENSKKQLNF